MRADSSPAAPRPLEGARRIAYYSPDILEITYAD
jgi:hypothetical protein